MARYSEQTDGELVADLKAQMRSNLEPVTTRILRLIKSNKMSKAAFFENSLPLAVGGLCGSLQGSQLVEDLQAELEGLLNAAKPAAVGAALRKDWSRLLRNTQVQFSMHRAWLTSTPPRPLLMI